eukprot:SAG31_NODE_1600_length_7791_cov_15.201508_1_plen_121_part_00
MAVMTVVVISLLSNDSAAAEESAATQALLNLVPPPYASRGVLGDPPCAQGLKTDDMAPAASSGGGGGSFGAWRRDSQGLPSYVYTRDQLATANTSSIPPSASADARHSTEHSFQLSVEAI